MSYHPQQNATPTPNSKADQIVYRVFHKLVLVVTDARTPASPTTASQTSPNNSNTYGGKDNASEAANEPSRGGITPGGMPGSSTRETKPPRTDKWFNLEIPDTNLYKATLEAYRSISTSYASHAIPPLHISVLLSVPPLNSSSG
ncbi:uncharacterized protein EI90DRAFT_2222173 [Cantharellus anzutake]|uniref:uncharacterized protein n=1 Tax=Cantharellus anzutake TaxID=1750568 RepID=UPI0019059216|nr:uncharacterized protein EI90DRAFT_2222173 [Cantharellus anzutake]KAF8324913.1 hypothetical protein EI90DRAFT_2222173 [Cantharellus anzutake]